MFVINTFLAIRADDIIVIYLYHIHMKLHCLSAYLRFIFKILLHVFKVVNGVSPLYLDDLIYKYTPHSLRSSDAKLFFLVPFPNLVIVDLAFVVLYNEKICLIN